jgi:hypothetical protein
LTGCFRKGKTLFLITVNYVSHSTGKYQQIDYDGSL